MGVATKVDMRVALISTVAPGAHGSMGVYGDLVLSALRAHAPEIQAVPVLLLPPAARASGRLGERWALLKSIVQSRAASGKLQADAFHLLDGSFGYMATRLPMQRTLVTVHDLIPALQAEGRFPVPKPGWAARKLIASSLGTVRRAGAIHADSTCTAEDVLTFTGRRVDAVIPLPVRSLPTVYGALAHHVRTGVLHVGNNGFYKNRAGVLEIFAAIAKRHPSLPLVMAGPEPTPALLLRAQDLGLTGRVRWVTGPSDDELATLYAQARLLLFPSWYEGFGWPPLEAMQHGCPVVCADTGSLPEVVGDAALLWSPQDIEGFAAQALRVLDDEALQRALILRGRRRVEAFSLQRLAEGFVPLYERLAAA